MIQPFVLFAGPINVPWQIGLLAAMIFYGPILLITFYLIKFAHRGLTKNSPAVNRSVVKQQNGSSVGNRIALRVAFFISVLIGIAGFVYNQGQVAYLITFPAAAMTIFYILIGIISGLIPKRQFKHTISPKTEQLITRVMFGVIIIIGLIAYRYMVLNS